MEKELKDNEFIVSKTDKKGTIIYANKPFIDIIASSEKEILGRPHNIVRHPDMPRAVFAYLWRELKNEKDVYAFVKNKTFDGGFYWVFATLSASYDLNDKVVGYYSVRRKISPKAKAVVQDLYAKMLQVEKASGMEASRQVLLDILEKSGKSYDEFILDLQGEK